MKKINHEKFISFLRTTFLYYIVFCRLVFIIKSPQSLTLTRACPKLNQKTMHHQIHVTVATGIFHMAVDLSDFCCKIKVQSYLSALFATSQEGQNAVRINYQIYCIRYTKVTTGVAKMSRHEYHGILNCNTLCCKWILSVSFALEVVCLYTLCNRDFRLSLFLEEVVRHLLLYMYCQTLQK